MWHSSKMRAHVQPLEKFDCWGRRFFFCKHKLTWIFFLRDKKWRKKKGDGKRRYSNGRCFRLRSHLTAAQPQLLNSHLLQQYFFVEWDRWRIKFGRDFPENGNFICFGLRLSPQNKKTNYSNLKMPQICIVLIWIYFSFYSFARINFKRVTSIRTHFAAVSAYVESVGRSIGEKRGSSFYLTTTVCDLKHGASL